MIDPFDEFGMTAEEIESQLKRYIADRARYRLAYKWDRERFISFLEHEIAVGGGDATWRFMSFYGDGLNAKIRDLLPD